MSRVDLLTQRLADGVFDLVAEIQLFDTRAGGRRDPIKIGWGCPCLEGVPSQAGWDGYPLLDRPMAPGEHRRVGFFLLSGAEAAEALRKAGRFQLWEGRIIGEGAVVASD